MEIPPGFGRDIERRRPAWVGAWVDGAMPFRAETIRGYLQAMHQLYLTDPAVTTTDPSASKQPARIEIRYNYNQDFDSVYAMVPSTMSILLALFPAILMALAIVREKELGSITNLYVTPVTRFEFLIGKQIPYVGVAMTNFLVIFLMALFVFHVPLKGSFITLFLGVVIYVSATTAYGMLISSFASTQIAAHVRHRRDDVSTGVAIFRHAGSGFLARDRRADHGAIVSHDLFPAHRRRHFHEGTGFC